MTPAAENLHDLTRRKGTPKFTPSRDPRRRACPRRPPRMCPAPDDGRPPHPPRHHHPDGLRQRRRPRRRVFVAVAYNCQVSGNRTNLREVAQCPEKAPTRPSSLLRAPISSFTTRNLLRHYAKRLNMASRRDIGHRCKDYNHLSVWLAKILKATCHGLL